MAITEATMVAYGRRTVFDSVGAKADLELWTALNDAVDMLAEDHRWPWFLRRGYLQFVAPYSTGTIAIAASGTNVTLTGGTWPTWAASGCLFVNSKVYTIASRTSGSVIVLDAAYGGDALTASTYVIFQDEYALPDNLFQFKSILPGQAWGYGGDPVDIETLWSAQNGAAVGQEYPSIFAVTNGNLAVFPYPSNNNSVAYSYYARPTPVAGAGTANVDWPTAKRQILNRAYDYHLALRFGKTVMGDSKACYENYRIALGSAIENDQAPRDLPGMLDVYSDTRTRTPLWKTLT